MKKYTNLTLNGISYAVDCDGYLISKPSLINTNEIMTVVEYQAQEFEAYRETSDFVADFEVTEYYVGGKLLAKYRNPLTAEAISYLGGTLGSVEVIRQKAIMELSSIQKSISALSLSLIGKTAKNATERKLLKLEILATTPELLAQFTADIQDYVVQKALEAL